LWDFFISLSILSFTTSGSMISYFSFVGVSISLHIPFSTNDFSISYTDVRGIPAFLAISLAVITLPLINDRKTLDSLSVKPKFSSFCILSFIVYNEQG